MNALIAAYKHNTVKTILFAGLFAGSLDILSAFIDYYIKSGKGPEGVLRYVASGVFGSEAFSGSDVMMLWGLLFHYIIAFSFTIFFFWLYPRLNFFHRNIILTAIVYGIFVWMVMNLVVVPLSNTPKSPFSLPKAIKAALILICMIGLPLSVILKKYLKKTSVKNGMKGR